MPPPGPTSPILHTPPSAHATTRTVLRSRLELEFPQAASTEITKIESPTMSGRKCGLGLFTKMTSLASQNARHFFDQFRECRCRGNQSHTHCLRYFVKKSSRCFLSDLQHSCHPQGMKKVFVVDTTAPTRLEMARTNRFSHPQLNSLQTWLRKDHLLAATLCIQPQRGEYCLCRLRSLCHRRRLDRAQ